MKKISVITPVNLKVDCQNLFYALCACGNYRYVSFLDSSLVPDPYSKFSYIAWNPDFAAKSNGFKNEMINLQSGKSKTDELHPLVFLKRLFNSNINKDNEKLYDNGQCIKPVSGLSEARKRDLPDFTGGFIGYLSYDLKDFIEKLPHTASDDLNMPVFYFMWYSRLLAYNHNTGIWFQIILKNSDQAYAGISDEKINFIREIETLKNLYNGSIEDSIIKKYTLKRIQEINMNSNLTRQDYLKSVKKAKEYIHNGDIYQVNMTQRFKCRMDVEAYDLYYILRKKNSAPFSAFLDYPELKIGSSSPERFLFMEDGIIHTRPIKGTRPRGKNQKEDNKYKRELVSSGKDRAELNMIVDLERNDLGKFCMYGTVRVSHHAIVEKYAKVFHLVSTVAGNVKRGYDISDIIKATFPGGSITGAPKIRAMEIIDELEPNTRGVYTGSIGYISHDMTMDLNIVIRTFIIKEHVFYYNVGGGIVEDSVPEEEYQETLDKGLALKETLEFFLYKNLSKLKKNI